MALELRIEDSPLELRCAGLRDGRLERLSLADPQAPAQPGAVLHGRVLGRPGRGAGSLVEIGEALPALSRRPLGPEGQAVTVQVRRAAFGGKGARVDAAPALVSPVLVHHPGRPGGAVSRRISDKSERARLESLIAELDGPDGGFTARTLAASLDDDALRRAAGLLRDRAQAVAEAEAGARPPAVLEAAPHPLVAFLDSALAADVARVRIEGGDALARARGYARVHLPWLEERLEAWREDSPLFALDDLEEQIAGLFDPRVPLPGGGSLVIEQTEALCAIDVNAGGASVDETNAAAIAEIPRQLRLRGLAGQIVVDFAGGRGGGAKLAGRLGRALAEAGIAGEVAGALPRLGLVVLACRRDGPPLAAGRRRARPAEDEPHVLAAAAARRAEREWRAAPAGGLAIRCAPPLADALRRALPLLTRRLGRAPDIVADEAITPTGFRIERSAP